MNSKCTPRVEMQPFCTTIAFLKDQKHFNLIKNLLLQSLNSCSLHYFIGGGKKNHCCLSVSLSFKKKKNQIYFCFYLPNVNDLSSFLTMKTNLESFGNVHKEKNWLWHIIYNCRRSHHTVRLSVSHTRVLFKDTSMRTTRLLQCSKAKYFSLPASTEHSRGNI